MSGNAATIGDFFDAWELFEVPALTGTVAGALLGFLGVYVVLRRMIFLSASVSQTASLGIAWAFYAQIHLSLTGWLGSPALWGTLTTLAAIYLVIRQRSIEKTSTDSLLGIIFLLGSAGTLILGTRIVQELHDIETLLFGTAVAVIPEDFHQLVVLAVLIFAVHIWWWRGFASISFDHTGAKVQKLPVRVLEIALVVSLALALATSTRIIGALPSFSFSVLPAMAAIFLAKNLRATLLLGTLFGALSGFGGYVLAFLYDAPVGASQTVLAAGMVTVAFLLKRLMK